MIAFTIRQIAIKLLSVNKAGRLLFVIFFIQSNVSFSQSSYKILIDSANGQWCLTDPESVYLFDNYSKKNVFPNSFQGVIGAREGIYFFDLRTIYNAQLDRVDSISQSDTILNLTNERTFAIIKNDANRKNYFVKKDTNSGWNAVPVLFKDPSRTSPIEIGLLTFLFVIPIIMTSLIERNRRIDKQIKEEIKRQTAENPLLTKSEKPIGINDEDLLGFTSLENAILSIIRNPQTELPMSIVISGDWGSGKSSMMNRIREKLETDPATKNRFMTSWFNAWHFQTEDRLLDSFLLNIISSYDRNYRGFDAFRIRLWLKRFYKQPPLKKFTFGFALAVIVPFILLAIKTILFNLFRISGFQFALLDTYEGVLTGFFTNKSIFSIDSIPTVGAGIIAVLSAVFLNKQLMPQGLNSLISLLPKTSTKFAVEKRQIGYREEFKKEYWEIIDAGEGTKRLVVFIDDIDRISGAKVLELLEAINFISDVASKAPGTKSRAPNTIFVLGMYAKEVTKNLGARLNEINNESEIKDPQQTGAFYIEKMIQLIVPIPFDASNLKKLL